MGDSSPQGRCGKEEGVSIKQVSVFIENREGRLAEVSRLLSAEKINIRSLSLADTADFGVLRLIVNDPAACAEALKKAGFIAQLTEVIALGIKDQPGGLDHVLALFAEHKVNVEYMYAFVEKTEGHAIVIFKTKDNQRAEEIAASKAVPVLTGETLAQI
jgi:hypothetical protein